MSVSHGTGLFCECKWRNTPVNMSVFRLLQERSEMFTLKEKYYCIFSRSGFESKLKEEATNNKQLILVSYEDILNS